MVRPAHKSWDALTARPRVKHPGCGECGPSQNCKGDREEVISNAIVMPGTRELGKGLQIRSVALSAGGNTALVGGFGDNSLARGGVGVHRLCQNSERNDDRALTRDLHEILCYRPAAAGPPRLAPQNPKSTRRIGFARGVRPPIRRPTCDQNGIAAQGW